MRDGALQGTRHSWHECRVPNPNPLTINLTEKGNHASGTGCSVDFEKHVYRDDDNKRVLHTVKVIEEGLCEMYGWSRNLITIASVLPDYRIEFVVSSLDD